ncbi:hypothetical protein [Cytobacillus gottheilii]|uniref:hypothetical protein n=1 Tax=Cytobacillus gottheilii TaxID=859144 RepID=UPI0009EF4387|nr:hypothetical protein [Cytobacillus gottheilii]
MTFSYILIILIIVSSAAGTLLIAGKSDENYSSATKGNLTRILLMYIILGIIFIIGAIVVFIYLV